MQGGHRDAHLLLHSICTRPLCDAQCNRSHKTLQWLLISRTKAVIGQENIDTISIAFNRNHSTAILRDKILASVQGNKNMAEVNFIEKSFPLAELAFQPGTWRVPSLVLCPATSDHLLAIYSHQQETYFMLHPSPPPPPDYSFFNLSRMLTRLQSPVLEWIKLPVIIAVKKALLVISRAVMTDV